MKRLTLFLAVLAITVSGCVTAFSAAQATLDRYKIFVDTDGNFDSATNLTYAYVDGTGKVLIGVQDLATGTVLFQYPEENEDLHRVVAKGWKLIWDDKANDGKGGPKIIEVPLAEAKAALAPPTPNP